MDLKKPASEFTTAEIEKLVMLLRLLINPDAPGRRVLYSKAKPCIALWSYKMSEHGVGREPPFDITIRQKQKITNYVIFGGEELDEWLDSLLTRHRDLVEEDNVEIHVAYGIYTEDFVNEHIPLGDRAHYRNRMTVFLIPVQKGSNKILTDDDDEVFNLGGLQP